MLLAYPDVAERKAMLAKLIGIEDRVWIQVEVFFTRVRDRRRNLERETEEKTSSVHFLRFELSPEMVKALKSGAHLLAGVDHPNYMNVNVDVGEEMRKALIADLAS